MNWYLGVWKQYAEFGGRAHQTEFWTFFLINLVVIAALGFLETVTGSFWVLSGLYNLAVLVPGFAVAVRRLHDTDRSGLWLLAGFVPVLGTVFVLVLLALDGTPGPNGYGPVPAAKPAA